MSMIGSSLFTLNYANLITGTVEIKNVVKSVIIKPIKINKSHVHFL